MDPPVVEQVWPVASVSHNHAGLLGALKVANLLVSEEINPASGRRRSHSPCRFFIPLFTSWRGRPACFVGPAAVPTRREEDGRSNHLARFRPLTCSEMRQNVDPRSPVVLLLLLTLPLSQLPLSRSTSPHRGNCRPIRFEPPMLDFHEQ